MNFLDIRAGETIEVGTQTAYRFWRYVFPPYNAPVRLLSWVSDKRWHPRQLVEGTTPDEGEQGIHGYKTFDDMISSITGQPERFVIQKQVSGPERLVFRSQMSGCDGVVLGTVALWGIIWDHARGYRAQFARPLSFISSYGNRNEEALAELRASFFSEAPV
jgi:hypothetical protein